MRRRFKSKTGFPLTKTTGDIARNRGFQKPSELNKAKRVRLADAETDASSGGHEADQSPRCGAPKTSEYAYFRKVKDGAANGHFRALHKENEQLKSSKISYLLRETNKESEELGPDIKGFNLSISGEIAGPSGLSNDAELTHKTKQRSSLLTETATPVGQCLFSSQLNQATEKSENQCLEKGLFSEKRKRLRQWVSHTTSSEVEKLHQKESDLVSFLLSRLIPKVNENNDSLKEDADKSSKSLTMCESENVEKGLSLSHKSNCHKELPKVSSERSSEIVLREWDGFDSGFTTNCREEDGLQETMDRCGRSSEIILREWDGFDSGFTSNCREEDDHQETMDRCGGLSEIVLRKWDSFDCEFPSNYHKEGDLQKTMDHCGRSSANILEQWDSFHPGFPSNFHKESDRQNKTMDPDQHLNSRICNSSDPQRGYSFCLPFESFRSLGAFHFKDLDEFGPIFRHGREEPYSNSLEWNSGLGNDRVDRGTGQGIVDNVLDTKGFCPSPILSSHCLFNPLPNYVSTGCLMHEVQQNFDDVKYRMVKPGRFSVSFPCSPKCIPLAEDKNADHVLANSNIILPYREPRWPKKVWDCTPDSEFWGKCSSAPEFSTEDHPSVFHAWQFPQNENASYSLSLLEEAPGESFTSFCEGSFDHCPFSSTLRSPLDTFMNCPLLLNHVSQDSDDEELYFDYYDNEVGYRNML
ncbi:uncharacterized protein LOC131000243 isoform X2 [Salvia miltiorrhiza]|uniref:uncharacterized protein LOC131000243 isoform X2 n=1 Tax=Salvia miltiorrhiza TaxID=226208 RepID=UPI0025AD423B|nr:uncharacterized protein LOC131000243 isoform X2 [Salvia miltiorrhiza]